MGVESDRGLEFAPGWWGFPPPPLGDGRGEVPGGDLGAKSKCGQAGSAWRVWGGSPKALLPATGAMVTDCNREFCLVENADGVFLVPEIEANGDGWNFVCFFVNSGGYFDGEFQVI